jgi:hypothetical protein
MKLDAASLNYEKQPKDTPGISKSTILISKKVMRLQNSYINRVERISGSQTTSQRINMAVKNGAIVFSANHKQIDTIIDQFSKMFDIELIHCETSYSKLWVTIEKPKEGNNDEE